MPKVVEIIPRRFWLVFCAVWAVWSLPIILHPTLIGVDALNHAARLHVLTHATDFADFYRPNWHLMPNLGVDLLLYPWVKLFPAISVFKVFQILLIGLTAGGVAKINQLVNGVTWLGLIGFGFSYHYIFGFGFLNYLLAIGLGLWLIAFSFGSAPYRARFAATWIGFAVLGVIHLAGAGLTLLAWAVLWKRFSGSKMEFAGVTSVLTLAVISRFGTSASSGQGFGAIYNSLAARLDRFNLVFESLPGYFGLVLFGLVLCLGLFTIRVQGWAFLMLTLGIGLAFVAPDEMLTSAFLAARIPIWGVLMFLALMKWDSDDFRRFSLLTWALIFQGSMVLGRQIISSIQSAPILNTLSADFSCVSPGSLVYQAASYTEIAPLRPAAWNPSMIHANCVVAFEKPVFVSNLFAIPSQQPLVDAPGIGVEHKNRYTGGALGPAVRKELKAIHQHILRMPNRSLRDRPVFLYISKGPRESLPVVPQAKFFIVRDRYVIVGFQSWYNLDSTVRGW